MRFSKPNISVHQIASSAKERVTEFALTPSMPSIPRLDLTSTRATWHPPTQGVVKINCDGATFQEQKKSGIGIVIQDNNGLGMASMSKLLPQLYTPMEIEALATSTALEFASELGFGLAILETDS